MPASRKRPSKAFVKLKAALEGVRAYQKGEITLTVRDVELKPPKPMAAKDVVAIRKRMGASQSAFARLLNVSPRTVQAWERDAKHPSNAALKLLHIAQRRPDVLREEG